MPELPDVVVYLESLERCIAGRLRWRETGARALEIAQERLAQDPRRTRAKARGIAGAVTLKSPAGTRTFEVSKKLPSGCRQEYNKGGETERGENQSRS